MGKLALNSIKRTGEEKLQTLRASSKIPAIVYGRKFTPVSIALDYSEFLKTYRISGETHIIKLSIDGKNQDVLVHEVQYNPVTDDFQHIDFVAIDAKEKLRVHIPLKLIGTSPATREGGIVDQLVDKVDVRCFPADIVDHFEFDISWMAKIGDVAHIKDLNIDTKKYEIRVPLNAPVVSILEQKGGIIEEEVVVAVDPSLVTTVQDEKKDEKECEKAAEIKDEKKDDKKKEK